MGARLYCPDRQLTTASRPSTLSLCRALSSARRGRSGPTRVFPGTELCTDLPDPQDWASFPKALWDIHFRSLSCSVFGQLLMCPVTVTPGSCDGEQLLTFSLTTGPGKQAVHRTSCGSDQRKTSPVRQGSRGGSTFDNSHMAMLWGQGSWGALSSGDQATVSCTAVTVRLGDRDS